LPVEVIGIDHDFVAVRDLNTSEEFYDRVMSVLGFRERETPINGDLHVVYYNRQFAYSLRPARGDSPDHDPYAPGLHHLCFRVVDEAAVDRAGYELRARPVWRSRSPATTRSAGRTTMRSSSKTPTACGWR